MTPIHYVTVLVRKASVPDDRKDTVCEWARAHGDYLIPIVTRPGSGREVTPPSRAVLDEGPSRLHKAGVKKARPGRVA